MDDMANGLGTVVEDGDFVHVMPLGDFREHESSRDCWCKPKPEEEGSDVIVHNSMDRREDVEAGKTYLH